MYSIFFQRNHSSDTDIHQKLTVLAKQALERAEELKGMRQTQTLSSIHESDNTTDSPPHISKHSTTASGVLCPISKEY